MKKRMLIFLVLATFLFPASAFAFEGNEILEKGDIFFEQEEPITVRDEETNLYAEFEMIQIEENQDIDVGIEPYKTITGSRGISTINYMSSASMITWSVKPDTVLPYTFSGAMKIFDEDTGKRVGWEDLYVAGTGKLADEVDLYQFNLKKGHLYRAILTGTAVDGAEEIFYVPSGAFLTFVY
ncbi:hypothetical protein [Anaerotignum sp.]